MARVYLISEVRGEFVKIGVTDDVFRRLATLQTANPRLLKVECSTMLPERYMARGVEAKAHQLLRHRRWSGEWFCCSVSDAKSAFLEALRWACGEFDLRFPWDKD